MEPCSLGVILDDGECHKKSYVRKMELKTFDEYEAKDKELIVWRSGLRLTHAKLNISTICLHHEKLFLGAVFERKFLKCCDAFNTHNKRVKGTHKITIEIAEKMEQNRLFVIPGWKLCASCYKKVSLPSLPSSEESKDDNSISSEDTLAAEYSIDLNKEVAKTNIDNTLDVLGISPIQSSHGLSKRLRTEQATVKVNTVKKKLETSYAELIGVENISMEIDGDINMEELALLKKKAAAHDRLNHLIRDKLLTTKSYDEKKHILTLTPENWTVSEAAKYFEVSEYLIREANSLRTEHGILAHPTRKTRTGIDNETVEAVVAFYEDGENSRIMPGKKDCVSIRKNAYEQKRLLLCNINELHDAFLDKYPQKQIGITKFYSLRPKWCVTVSSSGTHSVCVCAHHQNALLLAKAANTPAKDDYKSLMAKVVCDVDNRVCMMHRCENCPGKEGLREYLERAIPFDEDSDEEQEIKFQKWQSTDRCTLDTVVLPQHEFVDSLVTAINDLTSHSFLAKCQTRFLKQQKEELDDKSVIVLVDFAENFQFVIQDEIQSYHWNQRQCTLHPVALYYLEDGEVKQQSMCIISDDLDHDVVFVYKLMKEIASYVSTRFNNKIEVLKYFSDGCGGQYKNYRNMLNLCFHQSDFKIDATWTFFATSHGKSPCDGIGGTVKRTAARASLQRPYDDQILTAASLFEYCKSDIKGITFLFFDCSTLKELRVSMAKRFELGSTIPGTRSFHHFQPLSCNSIGYKRTSEDEQFTGVHTFKAVPVIANPSNIKVNDYVACRFYHQWWIGLVGKINEEEMDAHILFMHPPGPSSDFKWPTDEDQCWVPFTEIICTISTPFAATSTGRTYRISDSDQNNIIAKFN